MPNTPEHSWYLYLVEQASGALYTGITRDVERRFAEHQANSHKTARSLRGKGPLKLVFSAQVNSHSTALKLEYQIKKLPRNKKLALIAGELDLTQIALDAATILKQSINRRQQGSKKKCRNAVVIEISVT